jgi:hypothetical protein
MLAVASARRPPFQPRWSSSAHRFVAPSGPQAFCERQQSKEQLTVRLRYDQQLVCREFVGILKERGEKKASPVILALLREHLERNRKRPEDGARRFESAARQKRLREAVRNSLAAFIGEFLAAASERHVSRPADQLNPDAEALFRLGQWVAKEFGTVTKAKIQRHANPAASTINSVFADEFRRIVEFGLAPRSNLIGMHGPGSGASLQIRKQRDRSVESAITR